MGLIQLTQFSISALTQFVLLGLCLVYLFLKRSFRTSGWIMLALCASAILYTIVQFLNVSLPNLSPIHAFTVALNNIPGSLCTAAPIQLAYHFPIDSHRLKRESYIVFGISIISTGLIGLYVFIEPYQVNHFELGNMAAVILAQYLWAISVAIRSYITHLRQSSQSVPSSFYNPASQITRAFNNFLLIIIGVPFLISVPIILRDMQLIPPNFADITQSAGTLLFIYFLVGTYLNHSWQRTSFLAQLLGSIIVTQLILISIAALIFAPLFSESYTNGQLLHEGQTLSFTPVQAGYHVERLPLEFDSDLGKKLDLSNDEALKVPLPFPLPYFDKNFDQIFISDNRLIGFDHPPDTYELQNGLQAGIGVMAMDLDLNSPVLKNDSGVYLKSNDEKVTITWFNLPLAHWKKLNTAQLVLHSSGKIEMAFETHESRSVHSLQPNHAPWLIGLHTGEYDSLPHTVNFEESMAFSLTDGRGIIQDYHMRYRAFLHRSMRPMIILLAVGLAITFAGFPLFIGFNILRPVNALVNAVSEINQGNLNVSLWIRRNDEIGFLTDSFNQMVASIRDKNDQLSEYSSTLETRVRQRTAMLAEMTEKAEKSRNEAIEANQTKSAFIANITHEIRTPLNAIIGFSDILREDVHDAGQFAWEGDLVRIRNSANDLLAMINNILDISKIEAGRTSFFYDEFILENMVVEIIEFLRLILQENNNKASYIINASDTALTGDYMKIRQILQNLLSNSAKFTQDGIIQLLIDRISEKGEAYFLIQVRDTGIGLTDEQIDRIFEPFQQADNSTTRNYGGSGLGLAISRQYAEMMGGRLWVESKIGIGSTFFLTLPLKPPTSAEIAKRIKENGTLMK